MSIVSVNNCMKDIPTMGSGLWHGIRFIHHWHLDARATVVFGMMQCNSVNCDPMQHHVPSV